MSNRLRNRRGERGQAALFMTMTLTVTMGLIGLVVDLGWGYWRQEACRTAAEAAVGGGIQFAMIANTTWPPSTCTTSTAVVCQSTPTACPTNLTMNAAQSTDVNAACIYAQVNGFTASGKQNVTIAANTGSPPTTSGVTTSYYITARVSELVPNTFLSVITHGTGSIVSARATAGVISHSAGSCVYVLAPTGNGTLTAGNGVNVQSQCGFWINSSGATALSVTGGATLQATSGSAIDLVGGYTNANGGSISPLPTTTSAATDPFLSRNVPLQRAVTGAHTYSCNYPTGEGCAHTSTSTYACDYTNYSQTSYQATLTVSPGVYCGGLNIGNMGAVTFNPGVYILDGGGMTIGSSGGISSCTGSGVSFFNTGTAATYKGITIGNGVNPTFTAPTAGSMAGLLFYQDPSLSLTVNSTTTSVFDGGSDLDFGGSLYFPTTSITWNNGTNTNSAALVVYEVTFQGGAIFRTDTTGITSLGGSATAGMIE